MSDSLDVRIVTPAASGTQLGNRVTAERYGRLLGELGHRAQIARELGSAPCDVVIALHARRSAACCAQAKAEDPQRPLVLVLTGTDLYRDIHESEAARRSLALADRLVVLHPRGGAELEPALRAKVRAIVQSVELPAHFEPCSPDANSFQVCVLGHLRPVKDPLRTAEAARLLPAHSKLRVVHLGAALDAQMERRAREEAASNARYDWRGELPRAEALAVLASSHAHVLSSHMEGGANALCEAIACGVPTLSSAIASSVGILGEDYPGYFEVGDTRGLADLLARLESQPSYAAELRAHV